MDGWSNEHISKTMGNMQALGTEMFVRTDETP